MKLEEIPFEQPDVCKEKLSNYLQQAIRFTSSYEWMVNSYVAEFFVNNFWEKFPASWRCCFEALTLEEIAHLLLTNSKPRKTYRFIWPLSLLSFIATCHALAFHRVQKHFVDKEEKLLDRFPFLMTKHIKPKKRHELSVLPNIISKVCNQSSSRNVIDVGSGLGHLSRMLAIEHELNVTAIEMTQERLPLAQQFDEQLAKEINVCTKSNKNSFGEVRHIARTIHPSISSREFCELVGYNNSDTSSQSLNTVLVGLHTCGNLASTLLRMFDSSKELKGLVSVSCCYMGMTIHDSNEACEGAVLGFPMSKTMSLLNYACLKYKSFETACHFVDDYVNKLISNSPNLKLHCHRAVMEVILRKMKPNMILTSIRCRKIKNAAQLTFIEYVEKVLERVNLQLDWNVLEDIDYKSLLEQWKNVVVFHCLVHLMGPVVESIVLADKWMFLLEHNYKVNLIPIFDPSISPRNFALIAIKL